MAYYSTKRPSAPNRQVQSARKGRGAKASIPQRAAADVIASMRRSYMGVGFALGVAVAALAFGLALWLWAVPTVEGAVEQARQAASYESVPA